MSNIGSPIDVQTLHYFSLPVSSFFSEPDGEIITYSVTTNDTETWLGINSATLEGTRQVNTANGGNMTVEMTITATDPHGQSVSSNIVVLNLMHDEDPVISALPDYH